MPALFGRRSSLVRWLLAAPLFSFPANAQNAPATPDTSLQLEPLQVTGQRIGGLHLDQPSTAGSRLDLTPLETPASVQVLPGDTIRDRYQNTVNQAVSQATGFTGIPTPGNGENGLSVRGFTGVGSVTQLIDGAQLYVGSGTTTFPFDTWSADRIEVLSGPGSVLYGTGGVGGTVNVVPREPDASGFHEQGQLSAGSFHTFGEQVDSTGPLPGGVGAFRLDASNFNADGYVDKGHSASTAISAAVRLDVTPNLHITVSDDWGQLQPMVYLGTPVVNGGVLSSTRDKNYGANNQKVQYNDNFFQVKELWTPTDYLTVRNNTYWFSDQRLFRELDYYNYQPSAGQLLITDHREVYHHEQQYGDHGDVTVRGNVFRLDNKVLAGFDVNHVDFKLSLDAPYNGTNYTVPLLDDDIPNWSHTSPTLDSYRTITNQYAGYAEDQLKILHNLTLVAGLRFDDYSIRRYGYQAPIGTTTFNLSAPGWHVGTVYQPIPNLSLYAQVAYATDPVNNVISLTAAQEAFQLSPGLMEEVGVKQLFWDNRAAYTFAAYHIVKNNLLVPDPSNVSVSEQVGQQSSEGLEASVAFDLGRGFGVEANGTILRARFDEFSETISGQAISRNGNVPPNVPERGANLWLTWNFATDWQARANLQYVGKRYADNANLITMPGYYVVGAGLRWRPIPHVKLDLRVDNALNQTYAVTSYNGGAQWFLGAPLAVTGVLGVSF